MFAGRNRSRSSFNIGEPVVRTISARKIHHAAHPSIGGFFVPVLVGKLRVAHKCEHFQPSLYGIRSRSAVVSLRDFVKSRLQRPVLLHGEIDCPKGSVD